MHLPCLARPARSLPRASRLAARLPGLLACLLPGLLPGLLACVVAGVLAGMPAAAAAVAAPAAGGAPRWVTAWEAAPESVPAGPGVPAYRRPPACGGRTLRLVLLPELSGRALRLRISNRWGTRPLRIGAATLADVAAGAALRPGSLQPVRFDHLRSVVVPPHQAVWSDPLVRPVHAGRLLALSLYVASAAPPRSWHIVAGQVQFLSGPGDRTADASAAGFGGRLSSYLWLDRVDVEPARPASALVAIGDSITDGMRSTLNAHRSWPQQLAARLRAAGVDNLSVVDAGISGNRLLSDSACWGQALRQRFARDALGLSGVRAAIVLIGINDIDFGYTPARGGLDCDAPHLRVRAAQLEQALLGLARQAHRAGVRLYAATLPPADLPPAREALRQRLNAWIRGSRAFAGVVDFDAVLRDPADPARMLPRLDSGDHLHPDDSGYAAMARAAWPVALAVAGLSSPSHLRASASRASSTGASSSPRRVRP